MQGRLDFINSLEFAIAPIDFSLDELSSEEVSEQIESILQTQISQHYLHILNRDYEKNISHLGVRGSKRNASLIGSVLSGVKLNCEIIHSGDIDKLPAEILAVSSSSIQTICVPQD